VIISPALHSIPKRPGDTGIPGCGAAAVTDDAVDDNNSIIIEILERHLQTSSKN
jgi:hypothetical protein